jgi:DNA-binding XRE family transcriptional regulator
MGAREIKDARQRAGLTQTSMCDLLGISKRTIEKWEQGERTPPEWAERLLIKELMSLTDNRIVELQLKNVMRQEAYSKAGKLFLDKLPGMVEPLSLRRYLRRYTQKRYDVIDVSGESSYGYIYAVAETVASDLKENEGMRYVPDGADHIIKSEQVWLPEGFAVGFTANDVKNLIAKIYGESHVVEKLESMTGKEKK